MKRRAHRDVDEALAAAAADAAGTRLPQEVRTRILAATRAASPPRGRVVPWLFRVSAVAAAVVAIVLVAPLSLSAAELDPAALVAWNERVSGAVAGHLADLRVELPALPETSTSVLGALACGALALVVAGVALARREQGR